jgi:hypothetical protein
MTDDKVGRTPAREAAARRKRSERERKRRGIKAVTVEIRDLECWVDYLKGAGWLDAGGGEPSNRHDPAASPDEAEDVGPPQESGPDRDDLRDGFGPEMSLTDLEKSELVSRRDIPPSRKRRKIAIRN